MSAPYHPLEVGTYRKFLDGRVRDYTEYDEDPENERLLSLGAVIEHLPSVAVRRRNPDYVGLAYPDYLRTTHWLALRTRMLRRAGYRCQGERCEAEGVRLDVHHLTYERLGWEAESDLIVLCETCHGREHGKAVRS